MYMLERFLCKYKYFMFKRNYQLTCEMLMFETLPVLQERTTDKKNVKKTTYKVRKNMNILLNTYHQLQYSGMKGS